MRQAAPYALLRLALFAAMFASAVLVVDYNNIGDPGFCGAGSGCMAVRLSGYSSIGPVQLPVIGLMGYAALLALALTARNEAQTLVLAIATSAGALGAMALFLLQGLVIRAFCKWCVIVDTSAIVAAIAAVLVHRQVQADPEGRAAVTGFAGRRFVSLAWGGGAVLAAALPFIWGEYPVVPRLPDSIAALAVPGKVTIVSFTDFECPWCRRLAPVFHEIEARSPGRFALVRKMVPLPSHDGALPAALAYACVPEEGMAKRLYEAPEEQLTRDGTIAIARGAGVEEASFTGCIDSPGAKARVEKDHQLFESLAAKALPLTYVGPRLILGADVAKVRRAAQLALEPGRLALPIEAMLGAVGLIAALLVALSLREIHTAAASSRLAT